MISKPSKLANVVAVAAFAFFVTQLPTTDGFVFRPATSKTRAKKTALYYADYPKHVLATRSELACEARKGKNVDLPLVVVANTNPTKLRLDQDKMTAPKKKKTDLLETAHKKWESAADVEKHFHGKHDAKEFAYRLLAETQLYLINDPVTRHLLGPPVNINFCNAEEGSDHDRSSACRRMIRVHGKSTIGFQFRFQVQGSRASGIVLVTATLEDGIIKMDLDLDKDPQERTIPVRISASKISSKSLSPHHHKRSVRIVRDYNENVVRAEIVEEVEEEQLSKAT